MSERINDGGAAFPHHIHEYWGGEMANVTPFHGMTLRDYFAGQALAGLGIGFGEGDVQWFEHYGANAAYRIADAMIEARNK